MFQKLSQTLGELMKTNDSLRPECVLEGKSIHGSQTRIRWDDPEEKNWTSRNSYEKYTKEKKKLF